MRVVYLIQSHRNPEQIYRLVRTIKQSSSDAYVIVSHDYDACNFNPAPLKTLSGVEVFAANTQKERGGSSMISSYLTHLSWLLDNHIEFDWIYNLSGQCYPTQSLLKFEQFLYKTNYDAFIEYFDVLSPEKDNRWGVREGSNRYLYHYYQLSTSLTGWQRALVKSPKVIVNNSQPFVRILTVPGLSIGVRAISTPFSTQFRCYGGSHLFILSRKCAEYVHQFQKNDDNLFKYYKRTCFPIESFMQTLLVNANLFNLYSNNVHYVKWSDLKYGHPSILTLQDYPELSDNNVYFARKFDMSKDADILDKLDNRIFADF